nr:hypothetical protein GCM10020093_022740 [Planobispora longispora]
MRPLLWDRFPVTEHVAGVRAPTTVVFGSRDTIVPARLSRAVAEAAPGLVRSVEIAGAGHNDRVFLDGPELVDAVVDLAGRAP